MTPTTSNGTPGGVERGGRKKEGGAPSRNWHGASPKPKKSPGGRAEAATRPKARADVSGRARERRIAAPDRDWLGRARPPNRADRPVDRAGADLRTAESLLGQLEDYATWYEVETRVLLARAHAGLGRRREANEHLAAAASQASRVPDAPIPDRWIDETSQALSRLGSTDVEVLTPAELRVLQLLPAHMSLPQIAESLCVSPNTVKTHTRNIYAKFGVSSRRAALAEAERQGC